MVKPEIPEEIMVKAREVCLPMAKLYRKKPVVVEAIQWTGHNVKEVYSFMHGEPVIDSGFARDMWHLFKINQADTDWLIEMFDDNPAGASKAVASVGDWIIKGVQGEFYPCKQDIFFLLYDPVETPPATVYRAHPSHKTRSSDVRTYDEVCINCGATDIAGGGWGKLADPCPSVLSDTLPESSEVRALYSGPSTRTNSEIDTDERHAQADRGTNQQGGDHREIGGCSPVLSGGEQRSERPMHFEGIKAERVDNGEGVKPSFPDLDPRPLYCRFRLRDEGKAYPKSGCSACGRSITTGLGTSCFLIAT